jgi:AraC-like DNA-binding protein/mannose-6-phosphate isomerase-like protein (cupin superfamily)
VRKQPDGRRNSLEEFVLPDLEATISLNWAHTRKVESSWSYPMHQHASFELNLVTAGIQHLVAGGKTIVQQAGDIVLVTAGERHRAYAAGGSGMSYFCLHFDVDEPSFRQRLHRLPSMVFRGNTEHGQNLGAAMRRMMELTRHGDKTNPGTPIRLLSALFQVCAALASAIEQPLETVPASRQPFVRELASLLEQAVETGGKDEAMSPVSIAKLAARFGYSTTYCNRLFHEAYGISPRQYLSRLKLARAKQMLCNEEMSMSEIADRLGYRDVAHWSRQFKRWTGQSPSEYRRRWQVMSGAAAPVARTQAADGVPALDGAKTAGRHGSAES